jgi:hypothetical protein
MSGVSRFHKLPRPPQATDDSDLWMVNILISTIGMVAIESMGPGGTIEETHALALMLCRRGHQQLIANQSMMSDTGVDDFLVQLAKEIEK